MIARRLMKLINRIKYTWQSIMSEITIFEYVLIWIVRIMLLYGAIKIEDPTAKVMCYVNMLALYALTAIRFAAPKKSFLARLDFRCQHIVGFFEFFGTFFGKFLDAYSYVNKYDRILHFLSGIGAVVVGYYIFKALDSKEGKKKFYSPAVATYASVSFSFFVIVFWEITEFGGDYLFGSVCQCWYYNPPENDIVFRIFGKVADPGQFPVWDTMMDMIDATIATLIAGVVLYAVLALWKKHILSKSISQEALGIRH